MSTPMRMKERLVRRRQVYRGRTVDFWVDTVRLSTGRTAPREYLGHPGAAAVLAFDQRGRVVMVKQYRHPVGRVTYEIPAGKLDGKERPLACVKRELQEEAGFRARIVTPLLRYWPTPAFSNEVLHLFVARGLTPVAASPDEDEFLSRVFIPYSRALRWVLTGRIQDSKTVIALLAWEALKTAERVNGQV